MNATSACPGLAGLREYLLGRMSEAPAAAVEAHLAACAACRKLLPTVQAEDDLVADFRSQAGRPDPAGALLDRLAGDLRDRLLPAEGTTPPDAEAMTTTTPSPVQGTPEGGVSLAPPQQPDEIGRLGSYRILKELGRGGMGVVYQAEDVKLERFVALKAMLPGLAADAVARQRFLREAQAMAAVRHDHIVTIFQVDEVNGVPFLAMEFLQGLPMDKWLKQGRKPTLPQVLRIGREMAEGLAAAHERGLIHRDVKPGNVWLDAAHKGRVKILDFGLARAGREDVHLTRSGAVVGTPAYMAPEQARGEKVDARSDLFSLGCVLYRLLTGEMPFAGDTITALLLALSLDHPKPVRERNADCPAALSELVMRLLEKDPAKRPQSAREVIQALRAVERPPATGRATGVVPAASTPAVVRKSSVAHTPAAGLNPAPRPASVGGKRRRWVVACVAAALLAAATATVVVIIRNGNGDKVAEIQVPPGGTVQVVDDGKKAPAAAAPKENADDAWARETAALGSTAKQRETVTARLKERNPGFDGNVTVKVKDGVITELEMSGMTIRDLSPLRALPALRRLICRGDEIRYKSPLADLSPLQGMGLTELDCSCSHVLDLWPLRGMKLTWLDCSTTDVNDLSPLKGMPLQFLRVEADPVDNLSPLKGMPLTELVCKYTRISDLSPLKGMQLQHLNCGMTGSPDLSPLKDMPLTHLYIVNTPVADLSPLKGMHLAWLDVQGTRVADLSPLSGMPLTYLSCGGTPVIDLRPLKGLPLKVLCCDVKPERDAEILRSFKTLETINDKPAAESWKDVDAKKADPKP